MIRNLDKISGKNILLLQGPMGPFFKRLSIDLTLSGALVHKINFNGGDLLFYPSKSVNFYGPIDEWPSFLLDFLNKFHIDKMVLFGDCRAYHQDAIAVAKINKIDVFVFEEGYYRPDYITLEKDGVSNHSRLSRNPNDYNDEKFVPDHKDHQSVGEFFWHVAFFAFFYYLFSAIFWPIFNNYRHHRNLKPNELIYWLISSSRKVYFSWVERDFIRSIVEPNAHNIFIVPLQVNVDSQILFHSNYASTKDFIKQTIISFKQSAPKDTILVFKHHPLDRGYHNYTRYIKALISDYQLSNRVFYVFEQKLPILFKYARGVVIINSTSGLAAIEKGIPTKVCGEAVYSLNGLCFRGSMSAFWKKAKLFKVDMSLYARYKNHLMYCTQINGNFYKRLVSSKFKSGLMLYDKSSD